VDLNGDGQVSASEKGALRIANSWGTGWGEAGYMWIKYGCNLVGYGACYATY